MQQHTKQYYDRMSLRPMFALGHSLMKAKKRRTYQPVQRVEDAQGRSMVGTIMYQTTVDQKNAEIHGYLERHGRRVRSF